MSEIPRIRFVVLSGGKNGYPRMAKTYPDPPRVAHYEGSNGKSKIMVSWPGSPGWAATGTLADYSGHHGGGTVMVREIDVFSAERIEAIDREIASAQAFVEKLQGERVEACERAAATGRKVKVG